MSNLNLFPDHAPEDAKMPLAELGQYPTPVWVAEAIVERHFPDLDDSDLVLEPTCGPGPFLNAIPEHIPAFGVEIDPEYAAIARSRTGRTVLEGDIRTIDLPAQPTAIIGNPPFAGAVIDALLDRAWDWLPEEGRIGLILPAFYFKTASKVVGLNQRWSMSQEMIPQNIYPRLRYPLLFTLLSKDRQRTLVGFALYHDADVALSLGKRYRETLDRGTGSVWRNVVEIALERLGGEAKLQELYREVEHRRPTDNQYWKAKIRQMVQKHCVRTGPATWALPAAA